MNPLLFEECSERARFIIRHASAADDQSVFLRFTAKLDVVVGPAARMSVHVLPGVQQLVEQGPQDSPKLTILQVFAVNRDFVMQAEAVEAGHVVAQMVDAQPVDAEREMAGRPD